jgi:hypothetical protein
MAEAALLSFYFIALLVHDHSMYDLTSKSKREARASVRVRV